MAIETNIGTPREQALTVADHLEKLAKRIRDTDSTEVIECSMNMSREIEELDHMHPEVLESNAAKHYSTGEETWTITAQLLDNKVADENYDKNYRPA